MEPEGLLPYSQRLPLPCRVSSIRMNPVSHFTYLRSFLILFPILLVCLANGGLGLPTNSACVQVVKLLITSSYPVSCAFFPLLPSPLLSDILSARFEIHTKKIIMLDVLIQVSMYLQIIKWNRKDS